MYKNSIPFFTYFLICERAAGSVSGLSLIMNCRIPNMYCSKYDGQSICLTSNIKICRSSGLSSPLNCRTLSSLKFHCCIVKYSKHLTALSIFSCRPTIMAGLPLSRKMKSKICAGKRCWKSLHTLFTMANVWHLPSGHQIVSFGGCIRLYFNISSTNCCQVIGFC